MDWFIEETQRELKEKNVLSVLVFKVFGKTKSK